MLEWMTNLPAATLPAWWGAILSSILAMVKGWELWRGRFRVEIDSHFREHENRIFIRNLSPRPVLVAHWEVFYVSGIWPFRKETYICSMLEMSADASGFTIAPTDTHLLHFEEEWYFSTKPSFLKGCSVYIRLYFPGRRKICRRIYPRPRFRL
jgi:hypothetical protein